MPARARRGNSGEGTLTRQLRETVPQVTGIDLDQASIIQARTHPGASDIAYLRADFLAHPFQPGSFDLIASVATLHHINAAAALARMSALLQPGGVLAVIGLARSRYPADIPHELAAVIGTRAHRLTKTWWHHPSPTVWPPPETFTGMRKLAISILPGARYHRHMLWRYSLIWVKPT